MSHSFLFFFFFQAEDGIRDTSVTGVQTCALPIYHVKRILEAAGRGEDYVEISLDSPYRYNPLHNDLDAYALAYGIASLLNNRSEERRVGKECRSRWPRDR